MKGPSSDCMRYTYSTQAVIMAVVIMEIIMISVIHGKKEKRDALHCKDLLIFVHTFYFIPFIPSPSGIHHTSVSLLLFLVIICIPFWIWIETDDYYYYYYHFCDCYFAPTFAAGLHFISFHFGFSLKGKMLSQHWAYGCSCKGKRLSVALLLVVKLKAHNMLRFLSKH